MTFVLSKLLWLALAPGNLLTLLLVAGVVRLAMSGRRRGLGLVAAVGAAFLAIAVLPLAQWAVAPLEARFAPPTLPARVDGIILLGGAVDPAGPRAHEEVALNDAAERIAATVILARRYPEAKVMITGGEAQIVPQGYAEADATRALLVELGLEGDRMLVEDRSRNTFENAVYSKEIAHPRSGEVWLLVTSASHMPRAVGCFRQAGWDVVPYPVDYRSDIGADVTFALSRRLSLLDVAAKEWVGLVAYRLLGRTDALFPGP